MESTFSEQVRHEGRLGIRTFLETDECLQHDTRLSASFEWPSLPILRVRKN